MNYTEDQIIAFLKGVYTGKYDASVKLPEDLYKAISEHLVNGLNDGVNSLGFGETNPELIQELRENVYMFSGAKTYQQVREMSSFIADSASFAEFKKKALGVYEQYNKNWLRSEYNTAYGQGTIANQWGKIQKDKDLFPFIRYGAVMDPNTSEICRKFDGITLPVDDPFWDNFSPLNHFNCRCILERISKYSDEEITTKAKRDKISEEGFEKNGVSPEFQMNPYKDGYVFNPKHPYFEVAPKDKKFAEKNFDLPIPEPPAGKFNIEDKINDVKKQAKELHKTGEGKVLDDAQKNFEDKRKLSNDLIDKTNSMKYGTPEEIETRKLANEAIAEYRKAANVLAESRIKYADKVAEILKSRNPPADFVLNASKLQYKGIENLKKGEDAFKSIIGDKLMPQGTSINVNTLKPKGRAFYWSVDNSINLRKNQSFEVINHELGHALEEHNKSFFNEVTDYYEKRTKGEELVSLKKFNKFYELKELTKEDKFRDPYIGKWYANRSGKQTGTELTSMWFDESFENLERFIDTDPDYFEHFYRIFNR